MINKLIGTRPLNANMGILLLRVIFGGFFVYYGYLKIISYYEILPVFTDYIGIGSKLSFQLVIFAELVGGFLVLIGFWTRLAVIPIFITMVVVYFIAHAKDPFTVKQIALLYLLLSLVVFILGSGKYSVDALLQKRKPS